MATQNYTVENATNTVTGVSGAVTAAAGAAEAISSASAVVSGVTGVVDTVAGVVAPWIEALKVVGDGIGYVVQGILGTAQIAADQRVAINKQNNDWNLSVINSGDKNYLFVGASIAVVVILLLIIFKHKSS